MKIISLNVEGESHLKRVIAFLEKERAEVVCLMEAPENLAATLRTQGYHTTYAPMTTREQNGEEFVEGLLLASTIPYQATTYYYHHPCPTAQKLDPLRTNETVNRAVIVADIAGYQIATTHFTWTPRGEVACLHQINHLKSLLTVLASLPPHVLCGDFNIPRLHNHLYKELTQHYTDNIPLRYRSSLDPELHRLATKPALKELLDSFMVDYLFTLPPYQANEVRLDFGVSDHAAVVGTIYKT